MGAKWEKTEVLTFKKERKVNNKGASGIETKQEDWKTKKEKLRVSEEKRNMEEKRMGQMSAYIEAYCQHLLSVARVLITCLRIFYVCTYLNRTTLGELSYTFHSSGN